MTPRILVLLAALGLVGCPGPSLHPVVAAARETSNSAALALETAETSAVALYRMDQLAALERIRALGLPSEQAQRMAQDEIAKIRGAWLVVWDGLHVAHRAHAALRAAVEAARAAEEAGERPNVASVLKASAELARAEQELGALISDVRGKR